MSANGRVHVYRTIQEWREFRSKLGDASLGFVPTMGALHEGHFSLLERSARENDFTVASIFVNPTQFNDPSDLEKYPRDLDRDLELLARAGADALIYPDFRELYPDDYAYRVTESRLSRDLCGAHRPGHFDGVLTVVMKLLHIAQARRAYFGEKDYQQLELVRGMARAFFLDTEIVGCLTVRHADGLAFSSRNTNLNPNDRGRAVEFARVLREAESESAARESLQTLGFAVDYVERRGARRLAAVRVGEVRLIDNVELATEFTKELTSGV